MVLQDLSTGQKLFKIKSFFEGGARAGLRLRVKGIRSPRNSGGDFCRGFMTINRRHYRDKIGLSRSNRLWS
jgi:hypothetical protein